MFAADAAAATPEVAKYKAGRGGFGAGLVQRVSSFLVGAGLTALVTQYYIFQEVHQGNMLLLLKQQELDEALKDTAAKQKALDQRMQSLEKQQQKAPARKNGNYKENFY